MSVDSCLVRVTSDELAQLQADPSLLHTPGSAIEERIQVLPSPDQWRMPSEPLGLSLFVDEFTRSLLTDFLDANSPLDPINRAVMFPSQFIDGEVGYHTPAEVQSLAQELLGLPVEILDAWFQPRAKDALKVGGYFFKSIEDLLDYQHAQFRRLVAFY